MRYLLLLSIAGACGSNGAGGDTNLARVDVTLSSATTSIGRTIVATATGSDGNGGPVTLSTVEWSSSAPAVATVDDQGNVTAVAVGDTAITATSGGVSGSAQLTVDTLGACRLPGSATGVSLGFPRVAGRSPSTGDVRVKILFVDFSDAVATRTPEDVFAVISPGAEQYYDAVSYGRMHLVFDPSFVWLRMSKPTTGYPWNPVSFATQKAFIQEAANLATGVSFSTSDAIVVMTNPDTNAFPNGPAFTANPGDGVTVAGKVFDNGATSGGDLLGWGSFWFNHEFGHTMALDDLYDFARPTNPDTFHFTGDFSMMGNILGAGREYFAWERWLLGWVGDDQVVCASPGHSVATLGPVEAAGGTKLVIAPTGATSAVVLESRRALGYDSTLPNPGVLVYAIDTSIDTGHGVIQVLPINDDVHKLTAPLGVTQSLTFDGVTVTFTSQDADGDHVDVSY